MIFKADVILKGRTVIFKILEQDEIFRGSGLIFKGKELRIMSLDTPGLGERVIFIRGYVNQCDRDRATREFYTERKAREYRDKVVRTLKEWEDSAKEYRDRLRDNVAVEF